MMMDLSPADQEHCQDLTTQLLDRTLFECEDLGAERINSGFHSRLGNQRWKKLQSHPDITLYADRDPGGTWLPVMHREDWEHPVAVIAVGEMKCSINDVLLALVTPDAATQRMRSVLRDQSPGTNCEHQSIVSPTTAAPFQNLAVSRFVNTYNWPFTMFVGPRELVLVYATGEVFSSNGMRCGYELIQSVALQQTYPLSSSLPRTQVIEARVFWELSDGSVNIYSKFVIDAKNHLSGSVRQGILCRAVMSFWKFIPRSIEQKKLRFCMKNRKSVAHELQRSPRLLGCAGCGIITQKSQSINTGNAENSALENRCEICCQWLCGNAYCRPSCQLKMLFSSDTKTYEQKVLLCSRCIVFMRDQCSVDVARSELLEMQKTRLTN